MGTGVWDGDRVRMLRSVVGCSGGVRMGGGGVLARGAEKEVKKEKKKAGFGEYPPRERCDLYEPIKCECVGLTVVLCSVKGKCPFYKTGEQARKDRLDSIRKRRRKGLLISDAEARMLLDAEKMPGAEER